MDKDLKIVIPTKVGDVIVYPNADPLHPGVTVMLRQQSSGYEIDLVYIETCQDQENDDYDSDNLYVYCYEDVYTEDWTHQFVINKEDVNEALEN